MGSPSTVYWTTVRSFFMPFPVSSMNPVRTWSRQHRPMDDDDMSGGNSLLRLIFLRDLLPLRPCVRTASWPGRRFGFPPAQPTAGCRTGQGLPVFYFSSLFPSIPIHSVISRLSLPGNPASSSVSPHLLEESRDFTVEPCHVFPVHPVVEGMPHLVPLFPPAAGCLIHSSSTHSGLTPDAAKSSISTFSFCPSSPLQRVMKWYRERFPFSDSMKVRMGEATRRPQTGATKTTWS